MEKILAIGLMSGTSLDGIDAVLVEINKDSQYKIIESVHGTYSQDERERLFAACSPDTSNVGNICSLNMFLGNKFAEVVNQLLNKSGYQNDEISFISSHGQTIYHIPIAGEDSWEVASTLQIGDLSALSEGTGIGVVGDFRPADMAADGQGAPLTSFADYVLFASEDKNRAVQNIGGIGNVTFLPAGKDQSKLKAFDTGPGNMIIDEIVLRMTDGKKTYDKDGEIAYKGKIHDELLEELLRVEYLHLTPPKTTGRELFGKEYVDELLEDFPNVAWEDFVTTVTEFTCRSIVYHYDQYIETADVRLDEIIIGGGGSYNKYIMNRLQILLPHAMVSSHERFGISSDLKEAVAFALLGYYCITGKVNTIPTATGAKKSVIMGKMSATQPEAMERMFALRK